MQSQVRKVDRNAIFTVHQLKKCSAALHILLEKIWPDFLVNSICILLQSDGGDTHHPKKHLLHVNSNYQLIKKK